eukprot:scaffold5392_cov107-Cylindrotheca_fusiformis.AAC.1
MTSSNLTWYPEEILESFLLPYCGRQELLNIWYAICGCNKHMSILWPILNRLTEKRLRAISGESWVQSLQLLPLEKEAGPPKTTLEIRRKQSLFLSERLVIIEYAEEKELKNVLWCGRLEISSPSQQQQQQYHHFEKKNPLQARVQLLVGSDEWDFETMHAWNCHLRFPIIELRSQVYNFVPVRPFGRFMGMTPDDQEIVQQIRLELEATNEVLTLRFTQLKIILRIISPDQAQERLASFPTLRDRFETFSTGLLCCWEITEAWDDIGDSSERMERLRTIASMTNRQRS